jgi:LmbE family N-acetylglucosaminyl deacetylase
MCGQFGALAAAPDSGAVILQELHSFRELGSVLYIAAHPDDENTQLIAYLARGRNYRTAYLSVTRGDGGQNVLGPEFGDELGVIRTQELLAARRIDGGRQFFTRAVDFGFSKDYHEALSIWDQQQVLADVVRVIRTFQPDVVITRFSPQPSGTHGHHTASAVLAVEAFKLAGDAKAFPEQLGELKPWQPRRILLNAPNFGRNSEPATNAGALHLDVNGNDPIRGESFSEIAAHSRSMHKTQGFGNFTGFGGRGSRGESFQLLGGAPATNDIMDGIDTTWARVHGGAEIGRLADELIAKFNPQDPSASVPAVLALRKKLAALPQDRLVDEKRRQLDRILQGCLGLSVETGIPNAEVVAGEKLSLRHTAVVRSSIPVRWIGVRYPGIDRELKKSLDLTKDAPVEREVDQTLPAGTPLTQPYWLREDHPAGMFRVADASLIGRPENPPAFPIEQIFEVGGQTLIVPDEPMQLGVHDGKDSPGRRLEVIAPVSLRFVSEVKLFAPSAERTVEVEMTAHRAAAGTLNLEAPAEWHVSPAEQSFHLKTTGEQARFTFTVTAPASGATGFVEARAKIGEATFDNGRVEIRYDHIPVQLLQPPARLKAVSLQLATRGHRVGYVPGAGDSVAESLEDMGYAISPLSGADLTPEKLHDLDAVVIGIRAFNVRTDLVEHLPALFAYVQSGGNVVVQYNRPGPKQVAPFDLQISSDRVTDENAAMTLLAPEHPALKTPNEITSADFEGWVQERGLYFPDQWDEHFTPLLACNDPGESPKKGALLVAHYGQGYFVYTGLSWFRQLPAGVPGAYRLFANLISLGK